VNGLGSELLRQLVVTARRERLRRIVGYISSENGGMLRVARAAGFQTRRSPQDPTLVDAWIDLPESTPGAPVGPSIRPEPTAGGRR